MPNTQTIIYYAYHTNKQACTKNTALSKTLLTGVMQYKLNSFHIYYNVRHVYVDAYTANYMYIPTI